MRDSLLTIDCGNSTLDCLRHGDGARLRLPTDVADLGPLRAFVAARPLQRAVAASVVPNGLEGVSRVLGAAGIPMQVAGVELKCPLRLDYDTPDTLGVDRWVGALAAHRRHGRAIVVDCGSATTVNAVDADGTFRGGPIAPGLAAFAAGMAAVTPHLPAADLAAATEMPPRRSRSAVDTGTLLGYAGLVERLVAAMVAVARGPAQILVTGGNAGVLLRHTRLRPLHEADLVHQGLCLLAEASP